MDTLKGTWIYIPTEVITNFRPIIQWPVDEINMPMHTEVQYLTNCMCNEDNNGSDSDNNN